MRRILVALAIVAVGVGFLAYPTVSDRLAQRNGSQTIQSYAEQVEGMPKAERDTLWAAAERYNESLTGSPVHDPFIEGSGMAMPEDYAQTLNVEGMMGYVDIPAIGVHLPIYHGTADAVLRRGIGHLEGSTLPIGGVGRHSVVTGHTGLPHARLFTDLVELKDGDLFFIEVLGQTLAYRVDQVKVVRPHQTEELVRVEGRDYVTLLTCTPYGVNSHRLLVRGVRTEYVENDRQAPGRTAPSRADGIVARTAVATTAVMLVLVAVSLRRRLT